MAAIDGNEYNGKKAAHAASPTFNCDINTKYSSGHTMSQMQIQGGNPSANQPTPSATRLRSHQLYSRMRPTLRLSFTFSLPSNQPIHPYKLQRLHNQPGQVHRNISKTVHVMSSFRFRFRVASNPPINLHKLPQGCVISLAKNKHRT